MKQQSTIFVFSLLLGLSIPAMADNAQEKFWIDYIESCNPAAQLNGKAYFLGSTNPIGPGSVWGTAGGTANLVAGQEAYLGKPDSQGHYPSVQYAQQPADCSAKGAHKWDFNLGAPINILSVGNIDLTAALNNAKSAVVQIKGVRVDSIGTAEWSDATDKVERTSAVFQQAVDGHHFLLTAATAITGMTITYSLDDSAAIKLKAFAQVTQKVSVGSSTSPLEAGVTISDDGKTATLEIPSTTFAYVLAQFRPIAKMKASHIFKTITVSRNTGPQEIPVYKPNVKADIMDPTKINISIK